MHGRRAILKCGIAAFAATSVNIKLTRGASSQSTYFAGCFYDGSASPDSDLVKYLVMPERGRIAVSLANDRGGELRSLADEVLQEKPAFAKAALLGNDQKTGNPLFLGILRAMHESIQLRQPNMPDEFVVVISITATLDVVTSSAAMRNSNRFESLHSLLFVTNQAVKQRTPFTDNELVGHYRRVANEALAAVIDRGTEEFSDIRERAKAVFQVTLFKLPDPLPSELEQLISSATNADASTDRTSEISRLTSECAHTLSFAVRDELSRRKALDIALLPTQSPWTSGRALRVLQQRLQLSDSVILDTPDPSKMNGYEIRGGVVKTWSQVVSGNAIGQVIQVSVQTGSRIVRQCGERLEQAPESIVDPVKKIGMAYGQRTYSKIEGFERLATRDVVVGALRDSLLDLAKQTVDLMQKTAPEFGCS